MSTLPDSQSHQRFKNSVQDGVLKKTLTVDNSYDGIVTRYSNRLAATVLTLY